MSRLCLPVRAFPATSDSFDWRDCDRAPKVADPRGQQRGARSAARRSATTRHAHVWHARPRAGMVVQYERVRSRRPPTPRRSSSREAQLLLGRSRSARASIIDSRPESSARVVPMDRVRASQCLGLVVRLADLLSLSCPVLAFSRSVRSIRRSSVGRARASPCPTSRSRA